MIKVILELDVMLERKATALLSGISIYLFIHWHRNLNSPIPKNVTNIYKGKLYITGGKQ